MAKLISLKKNGKSYCCNARCYNAKNSKCVCICGGVNHGKGFARATSNTVKIADEWVRKSEIKIEKLDNCFLKKTIKEIQQMRLF